MMRRQHGFGIVAAIVLIVIMATLSGALVRLGTTQQATSTQDLLSARAWQVARAGSEWGLYRALGPAASCVAMTTLDLRASTGFSVSVSCTAQPFNEGESAPGVAQVNTSYSIEAVACNSATCPDAALAATPGYVERKRLVTANSR